MDYTHSFAVVLFDFMLAWGIEWQCVTTELLQWIFRIVLCGMEEKYVVAL